MGSFVLPIRKNWGHTRALGEIKKYISPRFLLGRTKLPDMSRTRTARATTRLTKSFTTTFESTNMQYLAYFDKHSKSYRQRSISRTLEKHARYLTPHKSNRATRCKKKIALDSSFNLSYSAPMALQGFMRKVAQPGSWTLKNFLFWIPRLIPHATDI